MADPFRVAFIGVDHPHGSGWRDSLELLQDEIAVVALAPGFANSLTSLEERYASLPRFDSVAELIQWGKFDGAVVCLPNDQCPQAALELAKAGKAILVEKPGAGSASDWACVAREIQERKTPFQSGFMWRYDLAALRLQSMISEQRFGKLISVDMHWVTSDVNRRGPGHYLFDPQVSGRGFFNWLACHWIDLLPFVTGRKVEEVTARVGNFGETSTAVEDGGTAIFHLEGGAQAVFHGGYWLPRWAGESGWSLFGSSRWVHWRPMAPLTGGVLDIHGPQQQFQATEEMFILPKDLVSGYGGSKTLGLLRDWIAQARGGPPCRNTPQSVLDTLTLLDAIYQSSSEKKTVPIS
ncbi:MAG: Gfo/Idh/MocA family oxidoreductase [Gemmataceae bacterium]|nr:Gfo/Idh/MocA family oxidoreductase [Gemmataceae bacterium]